MASTLASIETTVRLRLIETSANFWTSAELIGIINSGIKDLWRDIVDLKQEHYLEKDTDHVSLQANTATLTGVPQNVHKVYLIEARDLSVNGSNAGLTFEKRDQNHKDFQSARSLSAIDATNAVIYYGIRGQGGPVNAPIIDIAPQVLSAVNLTFWYVPTLATLVSTETVPIPGEADNALVAWTVAFAMAKEAEDRSPDPNWLQIYSTEKQHLLQSLGLRDYSAPTYVDALFEESWS